jgi:hypothetical protein
MTPLCFFSIIQSQYKVCAREIQDFILIKRKTAIFTTHFTVEPQGGFRVSGQAGSCNC